MCVVSGLSSRSLPVLHPCAEPSCQSCMENIRGPSWQSSAAMNKSLISARQATVLPHADYLLYQQKSCRLRLSAHWDCFYWPQHSLWTRVYFCPNSKLQVHQFIQAEMCHQTWMKCLTRHPQSPEDEQWTFFFFFFFTHSALSLLSLFRGFCLINK